MVEKYYRSLGYEIQGVQKDNVGWDLEARLYEKKLLLEVKGLSGAEVSTELTPNEYLQLKQKREKGYRICVVTEAMSSQSRLHIFSYSPDSNSWTDENGQILEFQEVISARIGLRRGLPKGQV